MQNRMGLLGKKIGMTQIFDDNGNRIPVTAIEVGPCVVVQKRESKKDGYSAIQLGFLDRSEKQTNMPQKGHFAKNNCSPQKHLKEVRLPEEELKAIVPGMKFTIECFEVNSLVDVMGITQGKGFAGVVKKFGFAGSSRTHGTHESFRHGGSFGCSTYPGRIFKGKKMPGQSGNVRKTVQNLKIIRILPEKNLLLVKGAIPGSRNSIVFVQDALKSPYKKVTLLQKSEAGVQAASSAE